MIVPIRSVEEFKRLEAEELERQEESLRQARRVMYFQHKPGMFDSWWPPVIIGLLGALGAVWVVSVVWPAVTATIRALGSW